MHNLRLALLAFCCLFRAAAATTPAIPLAFEQRDPSLFVARSATASVRFLPDRVTIGDATLRFDRAQPARLEGLGPAAPATYMGAASKVTFSQYPKLAMRGLYPGIDAIFYGHDGHLEYDLEIAAGASLSRLRLRFDNAGPLRLDAAGSLIAGRLHQLPPRVFQSGRPIAARYILIARDEAAIRLGPYDRRLPLTIDPELVYAKYFGGSSSDSASFVANDGQGNVYVIGRSNSIDFPAAPGSTTRPLASLIALTNAGKSVAQFTVGVGSGITAIAGTPDGQILYAASGSNVFYSKDAGVHWAQTGPVPNAALAPNSPPVQINDISVDAIDPSRAFLATNRGLFSTSDNGADWYPRDYDLASSYNGTPQAVSVAVSQVDHTVTYTTTTQPNYLYRSTDAGGTFTQLNPSYTGEPIPAPFAPSNLVFALAPGGSDLYAVDNNGWFFKSTDNGNTWQRLAYGLFGTLLIRIDPTNNANIFIQNGRGLQKSTDGGNTFTTINPPGITQGNSVTAFAYDGGSHTLYLAASNTIYTSTDQGATWTTVPVTPANIHTMQAIGGRVYVGLDTPETTFLVKFDPTGQHLLYSTFFNGIPFDIVTALRVDAQGNAYIAANSYSQILAGAHIFSSTPIPYYTGVVGKIAPDGSTLLYLSAIGATKGLTLNNLAIDSTGAAYLVGAAYSPDFPTTPNAVQTAPPTTACTRPPDPGFFLGQTPNLQQWAFASKISPDGASLVYSTFLTGSCGSSGSAVAVNSAGEAFVGGSTTSPDFAVTANAYQSAFPGPTDKTSYPNAFTAGFAVHLSAAGDKLLGSTFVGGGYNTSVSAITLDSSGNPVLSGGTWGITPGATAGAYQNKISYNCQEPIAIFGGPGPPSQGTDVFVLKTDPGFSKAAFLTYLGGSCADSANAIAFDPAGNIWLAGNTNSPDFPMVAPFAAQESTYGFVSEMSADGSKLLFSSFTAGTSLTIDPQGFIYVAGSSYTTAIPKNQNTPYALYTDAFLGKIDSTANPSVQIDYLLSLGISNAGSVKQIYTNSVVAPGEMIRLQGNNLGPATKVSAQMDASGTLPFTLGGTKVLFDGVPAPLNAVQANTIDLFVPFAVKNSTTITVVANGQTSNALSVPVSLTSPAILGIYNQDGTMNSAAHPAPQGSVIVVYMTGLGQTNPPSVDGATNTAPPAIPIAQVPLIQLGPFQTPAQFVAAAVGSTAGIYQVNVQLPIGNYQSTPTYISIFQVSETLYVGQ